MSTDKGKQKSHFGHLRFSLFPSISFLLYVSMYLCIIEMKFQIIQKSSLKA